MNYTIKSTDAAKRLDVYLAESTDRTRSQWQKAIKAGRVTVNGKTVAPHYAVREGDTVAVTEAQSTTTDESTGKETVEVAPLRAELRPRIIAETPEYLVIDKPAGLIVHSGAGVHEATLADWLLEQYPDIATIGDDPLRPGIVHRLDKEASGVMVIAKTAHMFKWLKGQFKDRETLKEYIALVYGDLSKEHDTIDFPIARSAQGFKMAALPATGTAAGNKPARTAITTFEVAQRFVNYTLVRVTIKTGRTHQIRVHFTAYGNPLVGDDLYGTRATRTLNAKLGLGRIFLHAAKLGFTDLDYQRVEFESGLPAELEQLLTTIK